MAKKQTGARASIVIPEGAGVTTVCLAGVNTWHARDYAREDLSDLEDLVREILTHTHATARLPAELLARVKAAVGE